MTPQRQRESDHVLLDMLKARAAGTSIQQIAGKLGCTPENVRNRTNNVMRADIAHAGSSEPNIESHYWTPQKRKAHA
jgi:hypothetical protein